MIYVTGDLHATVDIHKLDMKNFPQQKDLTKNDYLIILGDFGLVWEESETEKWWLDWLDSRNYTLLWIDGNHENFELLKDVNKYPIKERFGGKVQIIRKNVIHLLRGEIYTIENKTFFCMGGATSQDKLYRTEGESWWKEELPSQKELEYGLENLEKHGNKVDFILTHCAPKSIQKKMCDWYKNDKLTGYFEVIKETVSFNKWLFGHYHYYNNINDRFYCLYNDIIPLDLEE